MKAFFFGALKEKEPWMSIFYSWSNSQGHGLLRMFEMRKIMQNCEQKSWIYVKITTPCMVTIQVQYKRVQGVLT